MEKIWGVVLETSIYSSIVAIVLLGIKALLKDKISPKFHYFIGLILVVKLIIPFGPESNISLLNIFQNSIATSINYSENKDLNTESNSKQNFGSSNKSETKITLESQQISKESNNATNLKNQADKVSFLGNIKKTGIVPILWSVFAANILIWMVLTNTLMAINISRKSYIPSNRIINIFNNTKDKLEIKRNLKVLVQDTINTPFLLGLIKPKVMLPKYIEELSDKEIEYIILHELTHYKRKDNIVNSLLILLQSIHWFNPIIWYSFKKIRHDMELATDESVLYVLEEDEKFDYGKVLIKILEKINLRYSNISFMTMANNKKDIVGRIKAIKNNKKSRSKLYIITIGIIILTLSLVLLTNPMGSSDANDSNINIDSKIDKAISTALKDYAKKSYYEGELATEGHIVLGYEEKNGEITVYTVASVNNFEFKNDILTIASGQGAIPTVLIFNKVEEGKYALKEEKIPEDGSQYISSVKELFPKKYWNKVLDTQKYNDDLIKQQEEQAKAYLKEKGINKKVEIDYVEEKPLNINAEAANKLMSDEQFEKYPMHIGTIEKVENNKRYIYQSEQEKSEDNKDIIIFTKLNEEQQIVERFVVEIDGENIELISTGMKIYTADPDDTNKIIEFMPLQILEDSSLEEKLSDLCIYMQKEYFQEGEAKIFFEYINNNGIAIINLVNKKAWDRHFQGSTKGAVSKATIVETLLQRQYKGEWIKGIKVLVDGKSDNDFDHASFDKVIYR